MQAASSLNYHVDFGPAGFADFVGVGTLSTRPFSYPSGDSARQTPSEYVQLPKPDPDPGQMALNRYMIVSTLEVGGIDVTIGGLHLEWFGDPTAQTAFVAEYFRENVRGPAILIGDFNLEPTGGNKNAPNVSCTPPRP